MVEEEEGQIVEIKVQPLNIMIFVKKKGLNEYQCFNKMNQQKVIHNNRKVKPISSLQKL